MVRARARYDQRPALTAEPWWPAEACRLTLARAARNGQRLQSLLGPRSTCGQRLKVSTPGRRVDAMRSRKDRHSTPAACSMRHISRVSGANRLAACRVGVVAFGATGLPLPMIRVGGQTRPPIAVHGRDRLSTVADAPRSAECQLSDGGARLVPKHTQPPSTHPPVMTVPLRPEETQPPVEVGPSIGLDGEPETPRGIRPPSRLVPSRRSPRGCRRSIDSVSPSRRRGTLLEPRPW